MSRVRYSCPGVQERPTHGAGWAPLLVQPAAEEAEQPLRDEDHHQREDDPDRNQVVLGEEAREQLAQQEEEGRSRHRSHERPHPAHDVENDDLARYQEEDEVRRGELVLERVEHAGQPREEPGQHHRDDLVALDVVADRAGAWLVLPDRLEHHPERRLGDPTQPEVRDGHDGEDEPVERHRREPGGHDARDGEGRLAEAEAILAAGDLRPREDDDVEDLREHERRDREVNIAESGREVGDEDRDRARPHEAVEDREPEIRRPHGEEGGGRAIHAEPEERGVAERHHARVADQDVERHREQPPDQDLGHEAPPELREHERSDDEQNQDDGKADPVARRGSRHLGVGTKRPVGRNSRVKIRTTNETITACAGLTQIDAKASSRLMKMAARMEPPRLPIPPTTTTMKALKITSSPIAWLTPTSGPKRTPLAAAMAAPIANTAVWTRGTGMPIAEAMMRSWVVGRIQMPYLPYFMKSQSMPMIAAERTAMRMRYQGYSR